MKDPVEVRAYSRPWNFGVDFLIKSGNSVVKPNNIVFTEYEEGATIENSSLILDSNAIQQLMDDLWQCGYRPSEGSGSAGSLRATEKHLEDMRKLVFEREHASNTRRDIEETLRRG